VQDELHGAIQIKKAGHILWHAKVIVREMSTGGGQTSKTAPQFYIHQIEDKKKAASPGFAPGLRFFAKIAHEFT
jgi:hypothetical protein